jgi:hypothetical protein
LRRILATKSGWLIAVQILRETPKAFIVKEVGQKGEKRVSKDSKNSKLFAGVDEAVEWMEA